MTCMTFSFKKIKMEQENEFASKGAELLTRDSSKVDEEIKKICYNIFLKAEATDRNSHELWWLSSESPSIRKLAIFSQHFSNLLICDIDTFYYEHDKNKTSKSSSYH